MDIDKRRRCGKCNKVLQLSLLDHCMFCGALIPEHQQLSRDQKEILKKDIEELDNESRNSGKKRIKRRDGVAGSLIDVMGGFGGDSGDSDGGGD